MSIVERVLRPHYKKWEKGDGRVGRPPHNPVGLVLALLVELVRGWGRQDLVDFLARHPEWLRFLGLKTVPDETVWNKLLHRVGPAALDQLLVELVRDLKRQGFLYLTTIAGDSSFVPACGWDPDAAWGYVRKDEKRSLPVGRFYPEDGTVVGYGYRVHLLVDATREAPIAVHVTRADSHDGSEFPNLFAAGARVLDWNRARWLALDAGYDEAGVRQVLQPYDVEAVIAPKNLPQGLRHGGFHGDRAKAYDKRTAVERFFGMMKSFLELRRWGVTGLDRVRTWVTLALLACLVIEWTNHEAGRPIHSVKAFTRSFA